MKLIFYWIILLITPAFLLANTALLGTYTTVSESEWDLIIEIKENNELVITHEAWKPGNYEKRVIKKYYGTWILENDIIIVKYNGKIEKMKYFDKLTLKSLGRKDAIPGIKGDFLKNKGLLRGHFFWELNSFKALKWP